MKEPEQCQTMADVRAGVDALDEQIVTLFAQRFRFMDAAARIKQHRGEVRYEARKAVVISRTEDIARQLGMPPKVIADLYERLIEASIEYELQRFDSR